MITYDGSSAVCEECGSDDVRVDFSINPNTGKGAETGDKAWCEACAAKEGSGEVWLKQVPCNEWGIEQRRERARWALQQYADGANPLATDVCDLLADLRHLCDAEGIEFHREDRRAHRHYTEEKA